MMSHEVTSPKDERKYPFVPYTCLYIDATWQDVLSAVPFTLEPNHHRSLLEYKLDRLWNRETGRQRERQRERESEQEQDRTRVPEQGHIQETKITRPPSPSSSPIIPCLSVRTALDLLLRVKKFPAGSEVIFSAINIPSMAAVVRHHGLNIVSLDLDVETLAPKVEDVATLITPKTVAILFAHIFGRWSSIDSLVAVAKQHNLLVIEDCAESFCGLRNQGNLGADVSLFSFGVIKHSTAFGGAIAVVRDPALLTHMRTLYHTYPIQPRGAYLWKVLKYSMVMTLLNSPALIKYGKVVVDALGIEAQEVIVSSIRAFPTALIDNIRLRPSVTLLYMLYRKLKNFDCARYNLSNIKAEFVLKRLPQGTKGVGLKASQRNHWLFPIIVDDPDRVVKELRSRGIDTYRGATQLDLIEPDVPAPPRLQGPGPAPPRLHGLGPAPPRLHGPGPAPPRLHGPVSLSQGGQTTFPVAEEAQASFPVQRGIQPSGIVHRGIQPSVSIPQGQQVQMSVPSELLKSRGSSGTTPSSAKEPNEQGYYQLLPCVDVDMGGIHPPERDSMCVHDHVSDRSSSGSYVDYSNRSEDDAVIGDAITRHTCRQDAVRKASEVASSMSGNSPHASDNCRTTNPLVPTPPQSSNEQTPPSPAEGAQRVKEAPSQSGRYPSEARYLMEHVVYLPVHRLVSFHYLEQICSALEDTMQTLSREKAGPPGSSPASKVRVQSKL